MVSMTEFALAVIFGGAASGGGAGPFMPRVGETQFQLCQRAAEAAAAGKVFLFEEGKSEGISLSTQDRLLIYFPTKYHKDPIPCANIPADCEGSKCPKETS